MSLWIKNTDGKPDAILTMSVVGFAVVLIKVLLGGHTITNSLMNVSIEILPIDAATIGAILTPTLSAYVARRFTDKKYNVDLNNNGVIDPEEKES